MGTFGWSMIVSRRVCVTAVAVLICAVGGWGDMFGQVEWQDDFEDGNYTSNPAWDTFSSPGSSAAVSTWEGDYALGPSAMYIGDPLYSGWSGAYVDQVEGNQGILGWLDISQAQSDDTAGVYMVRYTESTVGGMGTGYAMSVNYSDSEQLWTQFWQFDDTSMAATSGSGSRRWGTAPALGFSGERGWTGSRNQRVGCWTAISRAAAVASPTSMTRGAAVWRWPIWTPKCPLRSCTSTMSHSTHRSRARSDCSQPVLGP